MAEQQATKSGRWQKWRERRRAKAERTRGIARRQRQRQDLESRSGRDIGGPGGAGMPFGP